MHFIAIINIVYTFSFVSLSKSIKNYSCKRTWVRSYTQTQDGIFWKLSSPFFLFLFFYVAFLGIRNTGKDLTPYLYPEIKLFNDSAYFSLLITLHKYIGF